MANVYFDPEEFGVVIEDYEDRGYSYEFDMFVIWRRAENDDGMRWWGEDSGCSCPSPFQNCSSLADLNYGSKTAAYDAYHQWQHKPGY